MSYLYRAKVGQKGFFGGKIRVNTGNGEAEVFRSKKKLLESKKVWYEFVSEEKDEPSDDKAPKKDEGGYKEPVQHDPNAIADAFSAMDHSDNSQWKKDNTPKLSALNGFYKGPAPLKAEDVADLHLKRVVADGE